jgi:hypothetical protein
MITVAHQDGIGRLPMAHPEHIAQVVIAVCPVAVCRDNGLVLDAETQAGEIGRGCLLAGLGHDEVKLARPPAGRWEVEPLMDAACRKIPPEGLACRAQVAQDAATHRTGMILKPVVVKAAFPDVVDGLIERSIHPNLIA